MDEYLIQLLFVFANTSRESAFWDIAVTLLLLKGCNLILGFEQVHLFLHITQVSSREFFANSVEFHAEEQNCTNAGAACIYLSVVLGCRVLL